MDIGHFMLAMDSGLFRDAADFRADVTAFCDTLRATKPADPAKPVMVAGDPERRTAARRRRPASRWAPVCSRRCGRSRSPPARRGS